MVSRIDYHEPKTLHVETEARIFALVVIVIFYCLSLFPLLFGRGIRWWAFCVASAMLVACISSPKLLLPFVRAWTRFGLLVQKFTQPLILGIVFFLAVTPAGIILRLLGKDQLRLSRAAEGDSYWKMREHATTGDMKQQF